MKSITEFQNSKIGSPISINHMINLKGGVAESETAGSPAGGVCTNNGGCVTWQSDTISSSGVTTYYGLHVTGQNCS